MKSHVEMKTTKKLTGRDSVVSSCLMRLEWVGISVRGNAPIRITLIHHRNGSVSDCVGFYLACGGPPSPQGGRLSSRMPCLDLAYPFTNISSVGRAFSLFSGSVNASITSRLPLGEVETEVIQYLSSGAGKEMVSSCPSL